MVRQGLVSQVVRGVYLDVDRQDDTAARAACLALKLPPGAVLCRRTAAWLWGVDARAPSELSAPLVVECVVPLGRQPVRRPGVRGYVARLPDDDRCELAGVPVTSAERTALDTLRWLAPHMGLGVADALAHRALVDPSRIVERLERLTNAPGVRQARYLASLIEPLTESFGESWLRLRIIDAGFPRPRAQIEVVNAAGRCVHRLDLGWDEVRVAVEYDGEEFHSSTNHRERDRRRRVSLESEYGWALLAVGRGEVLGRSLALERGIGELLGMSPCITRRRW